MFKRVIIEYQIGCLIKKKRFNQIKIELEWNRYNYSGFWTNVFLKSEGNITIVPAQKHEYH